MQKRRELQKMLTFIIDGFKKIWQNLQLTDKVSRVYQNNQLFD